MDEERQPAPPVLSVDTIQNLKCAFCRFCLTVPPINITSLHGDQWKCGRCSHITTDYNIPALLFETVVKSVSFPCAFEGCWQLVPCESMKQHEETCGYQPIKCPCGETMAMRLALWHFRQNHPDIVSYNRAVIDGPDYCKLLTRLILVNNVPFIVYILCERQTEIKVGTYALEHTEDVYEVQLKLGTNSGASQVTLPTKKISKFRQRENCADCLLKTCQIRYHRYYESNQNMLDNDVYEMMSLRVDTMSALNVLGTDHDDVILTITVTQQPALRPREPENVLEKNEQARKMWECQICQEYLVGPIYICPTGHSICSPCKAKMFNCPYCVMPLGECRNFTLEMMAESVEIVCQYEERGCNFSGNVELVAIHERQCPWNKEGRQNERKKVKVNA